MAYWRSPNLRDKLVRADLGPNKVTIQQTISGSQNPGTFPCLSCAQCNNVQKGCEFSHPRTSKKYNIQGHFNRNSSYVIYLIKCPCGLGYVGETTQWIKDRISQHKYTIRNNKLDLPIPSHFALHRHSLSQWKFQIIDWIPPPRRGGDRIKILKSCEIQWIFRLETLHPRGLNRDYTPIWIYSIQMVTWLTLLWIIFPRFYIQAIH